MPEYLPLGAFRQGLLPGDCRSCAWWQTAGAAMHRGAGAAEKRNEWLTGLEREWGHAGLLVYDSASRGGPSASADPVISASIHFAPASSLARLRELPFPPLPPASALLFCLHTEDDAPRWAAKRIIRKALYELHDRGIEEVYAVGQWTHGNGGDPDCRFLSAELLAENGFTQVASSGRLSLMRVENRSLITLIDHVESAVRRVFAHEREPAPSPAAWAAGGNEADAGSQLETAAGH